MDNEIDTKLYYASYTRDGVRTFAPTNCRIPAHMGRQFLKDKSNISDIQEYIRNTCSYELLDPESIKIYNIRVVEKINL